MFNLLYISWFIIFVESLSIERSSLEESNSDQVRFARADFPPLDYYSGHNNDDYIAPELKVNRYEPRELEYHSDPRKEIYPNAPMEMYPTAPLTQIEPRATFNPQFQRRSSVSELQHPFNVGNGKSRLINMNPNGPLILDEETEVNLGFPNEQQFPVISYFVPNNQEPNTQEKRSKQDPSEHQMAQSNVNQKLNRSKQEMKYEQEVKRDRKNKGEPYGGELYSEIEQSNSSELDNKTTPNNFQ